MVVIVVENVPAGLRGELSRWMLEPHTGVFVGTISATVREKLWEKVCRECKEGHGLMMHRAQNEQGFVMRTHGPARRQIWEVEGLSLVRSTSL